MTHDLAWLGDEIRRIHVDIRDHVVAACEASALEQLAAVHGEDHFRH